MELLVSVNQVAYWWLDSVTKTSLADTVSNVLKIVIWKLYIVDMKPDLLPFYRGTCW